MLHPHPTALLPGELLSLAIDYERLERSRYRELAFRFLTFGHGVSSLMAALGIECEARLADLQWAARDIDQASMPDGAASRTDAPSASGGERALVDDRSQALSLLRWAMTGADHAARVTEHLQRSNITPALQTLLQGMSVQKRAECHILSELVAAHDMEFMAEIPSASHAWPRGWLAGARCLPTMPTR